MNQRSMLITTTQHATLILRRPMKQRSRRPTNLQHSHRIRISRNNLTTLNSIVRMPRRRRMTINSQTSHVRVQLRTLITHNTMTLRSPLTNLHHYQRQSHRTRPLIMTHRRVIHNNRRQLTRPQITRQTSIRFNPHTIHRPLTAITTIKRLTFNRHLRTPRRRHTSQQQRNIIRNLRRTQRPITNIKHLNRKVPLQYKKSTPTRRERTPSVPTQPTTPTVASITDTFTTVRHNRKVTRTRTTTQHTLQFPTNSTTLS